MAKGSSKIGGWAFILGVVVAVLIGLFGNLSPLWLTILVVLGLLVGFLNVTGAESTDFLLAAVALVIVVAFGRDVLSAVALLGRVLEAMIAFVVPATVVVALKAIYSLARS
ncbi:MAG: hypothetical protein AABW56_04620 [Nanoarchaeota archaeon]